MRPNPHWKKDKERQQKQQQIASIDLKSVSTEVPGVWAQSGTEEVRAGSDHRKFSLTALRLIEACLAAVQNSSWAPLAYTHHISNPFSSYSL